MSYLDKTGLTRFKQKLDALFSGKLNTSLKGTAGGLAELDENGKVPSSQLPSYVDDVLEFTNRSAFPLTGESGKIYVDLSTNLPYRWSGSTYIEVSQSLALGETESSAYRGDRGKQAYDHATDSNKISSAVPSGLYKVSVTNEGHISAVTAVSKTDITDLGIPGDISGKLDTVLKGRANGLAELDSNGKVPSSQSHSNIYEYASLNVFPLVGESECLYIALDTNIIYRWDETTQAYIPISSSGGESVLTKVAFSIQIADWTVGANTYSANITYPSIVSSSEEFIIYDSSMMNLTSNILTEKNVSSNSITFTVSSLPNGVISGTIYILVPGEIVADTKLNINQGVANAGKFLVVGSDGNIIPVAMQAWQGGNY